MKTLEQRVQAIESQLGRARRANRLLGLVLVALLGMAGAQGLAPSGQGQATTQAPSGSEQAPAAAGEPLDLNPPHVVEAERFVLVDEAGQPRATLAADAHGPALHLLGADETPVVSLRGSGNGGDAGLEIRGAHGRTLTTASGVSVKDEGGQPRLTLALMNGNFPVLGISQVGQNGPPSIELTAGDNGSRFIKVHNQGGKALFTVAAAEDQSVSVSLRHPDHHRSFQLSSGAKASNGPVLALFAPASETGEGGRLPRLQLGLRPDHQPYLRLADGEGRALFQAPGG